MKNYRLLFLGDTFLPRTYDVDLSENIPYVINLEAPITKNDCPIPGKINLVCRDDNIGSTFHRLPLAVCLANNHIMDYGEKGFDDTLELLKKQNIKFFGAGKPVSNYNNPLIVDCAGISVALFGYCYLEHIEEIKKAGLSCGPAPLNFDGIAKDIEPYKGKIDRIIVNLHWGVEESHFPEAKQVLMARKIIDAEVDCVIGHHAHVIQPVESYNDAIIAYGLGNFIFDDLDAPANCNVDGIPQYRYRKRQRKWNRSSIGLSINLEDLHYEVKNFYFDKYKVISKGNSCHRYAEYIIPDDLEILSLLIKRNYRKYKILRSLYTYFDRPKIPSFKGIRNFIKLLCFTK